MISFDFDYYKPTSITEAIKLFHSLDKQGKKPVYFSGGTEVITLGRTNQIETDAVIDIKAIPECRVLEKEDHKITLGATLSLTKIREKKLFPFLNKAIVEIADQTARNKITLGGNICGNIFYRETVLPLLLTNSQVRIATQTGLKQLPINEVFQQTLRLDRGDFLVQVIIEESEMKWPFLSVKKRRQFDVGYPLLTVAALKKNDYIKFAFSGLCAFPFRDEQIEESLNNHQLTKEERVEEAIKKIPSAVLDDVHGSKAYRLFVLRNTLQDVLDELEGALNA